MSTEEPLPKKDRGAGRFNDYGYGLIARNRRIRMILENSDPYQDELRDIVMNSGTRVETAMSPRTREEEAVDAPMEVRVFIDRRVIGPVGRVPRGLEAIVEENLRLLSDATGNTRIPVEIVRKGSKLRVALLLGELRNKLT